MVEAAKLILGSPYEGKKAAKYEERRWEQPVWKRESAVVERMVLAEPRPKQILDVPCGSGRFFGLYSRMNIPVTAVDISPAMLALARTRARRKNITLVRGDILDLKERADCTLCIRLLHLVDEPTMRKIFGHVLTLTRHRVILTVPLGSETERYGDTARHDARKFRALVRRMDFEIMDEEDVSGRGRWTMRLERVA